MTDRPTPRSRFAELPELIKSEDMVTSLEASPVPETKDDYWREVEWMLKITGAG